MLGAMRARALLVLVVLLVPTTAVLLGGCGTASAPSPPAGVDGLEIPTPSPRTDDFTARVDNPYLPLPLGATWTYQVVDVRGAHEVRVSTRRGPTVDGVATTARVARERGRTVTDWYAEDRAGNVWWFGRAGVWRAGADGAEAGLAMAATPRVGDGYRPAYAPGVVDEVARVADLGDVVALPAGSYDDVLVVVVDSRLHAGEQRTQWFARGVGLVEQTVTAGAPRTLRLASFSG
jgi:hypothetical protein